MLSTAADRILDLAVAPGYGSPGYRLRSRSWGPRLPRGALERRDVLVTGASSGIGEAACGQLVEAGARVHMLVRDRERGEAARRRVASRGRGAAELHLCDIADLASVREFAASFAAEVPALAGILHNAGVLTAERQHSPQGIELTFATAVVGPFLLTRLLEEPLRRDAPSRVVWVTSGGMLTAALDSADPQLDGRDFDGPRFYAHAKRAQVVLARLFAAREPTAGVGFHAMHPGWVDTPGLARIAAALPPRAASRSSAMPSRAPTRPFGSSPAPTPEPRSGQLWHDRRPRRAHRVPGTRETEADRALLWAELDRLAPTGGAS